MMRRIDFEFVRRRSRSGARAGWALLGLGLLTASAVAVLYTGVAERSARWETAVRKVAHADAGRRNDAGENMDAQARTKLVARVADANDVINRLSLPWNALFRSIESAALDNVALLGVQPQPQQRMVTLAGEARSYADVLDYMERLDASTAFSHSRLVSHKVRREDPVRPVEFVIAAQWRVGP